MNPQNHGKRKKQEPLSEYVGSFGLKTDYKAIKS